MQIHYTEKLSSQVSIISMENPVLERQRIYFLESISFSFTVYVYSQRTAELINIFCHFLSAGDFEGSFLKSWRFCLKSRQAVAWAQEINCLLFYKLYTQGLIKHNICDTVKNIGLEM